MWTNITVLMLVAFVVHVADIITTHIGMSRGFPEGNPIAAWFMATIGFWQAVILLKSFAMCCSYITIRAEVYIAFWFATCFTFIVGPLGWTIVILLDLRVSQ